MVTQPFWVQVSWFMDSQLTCVILILAFIHQPWIYSTRHTFSSFVLEGRPDKNMMEKRRLIIVKVSKSVDMNVWASKTLVLLILVQWMYAVVVREWRRVIVYIHCLTLHVWTPQPSVTQHKTLCCKCCALLTVALPRPTLVD
jgi:hypothetical protein